MTNFLFGQISQGFLSLLSSSLAAEILPQAHPGSGLGPEKSLLHEKLFEKNSALARGFANWVDDHYNKVSNTKNLRSVQ